VEDPDEPHDGDSRSRPASETAKKRALEQTLLPFKSETATKRARQLSVLPFKSKTATKRARKLPVLTFKSKTVTKRARKHPVLPFKSETATTRAHKHPVLPFKSETATTRAFEQPSVPTMARTTQKAAVTIKRLGDLPLGALPFPLRNDTTRIVAWDGRVRDFLEHGFCISKDQAAAEIDRAAQECLKSASKRRLASPDVCLETKTFTPLAQLTTWPLGDNLAVRDREASVKDSSKADEVEHVDIDDKVA